MSCPSLSFDVSAFHLWLFHPPLLSCLSSIDDFSILRWYLSPAYYPRGLLCVRCQESLILSFIHSFIHLFIHSVSQSISQSVTHSLTHSIHLYHVHLTVMVCPPSIGNQSIFHKWLVCLPGMPSTSSNGDLSTDDYPFVTGDLSILHQWPFLLPFKTCPSSINGLFILHR